MPNIFRWRNCRFYFYSHEGNEPPHVHIDCAEKVAKVWLAHLSLAYAEHFNSRELKNLLSVVEKNQAEFLEAWHAHFR